MKINLKFLLFFLILSLGFLLTNKKSLAQSTTTEDRYIGPADQTNCGGQCPSLYPQCSGFQDSMDQGKTYFSCTDLQGNKSPKVLGNAKNYSNVVPPEWYQPNLPTYQQNLQQTSINNSQYMNLTVTNTAAGIAQNLGLAKYNSSTQSYIPTGAIGNVATLNSFIISNPPVSTAEYIADIQNNLGFKTAYAQSTGYKALSVVLPIWKAFRNIAYLAFIIIFIIVGFMIMFGQKIGQAAMSIQIALPQIIITLLIITFSYAIAALLIDSIYFFIYLAINIFQSFHLINNSGGNVQRILLDENIVTLAWKHLINVGESAGRGADAAGSTIQAIIQGMLGQTMAQFTRIFTDVFGYLIIAIAILIYSFKTLFQLIMAYMGIILGVIFAPIILLANAIPGSKAFSQWLKSLIANAIVFPVIAILFLVSAVLLRNPEFGANPNFGYNPSAGGSAMIALPFISLNTNAMMGIIGLGMLMIMPKIIEIIQKSLGVEAGLAGMIAPVLSAPLAAAGAAAGQGAGMYGKSKMLGFVDNPPQRFGPKVGGWISRASENMLRSWGVDVDSHKFMKQAARGK